MTRDQAEREIVQQLKTQWEQQTANGYTLGKSYPATIRLNGRARLLAMFKKASNGVLHVESLDKLIYGYTFTQYKITKAGKLQEIGSRNLYSMTKEAQEQHVKEFAALFA